MTIQPFKLWHYSCSHFTLLIRRPKQAEGQNHDHLFTGVTSIDFTSGLCFDDLQVIVYDDSDLSNKIYDLIGYYRGEEVSACIVASNHKNYKNDFDLFELFD